MAMPPVRSSGVGPEPAGSGAAEPPVPLILQVMNWIQDEYLDAWIVFSANCARLYRAGLRAEDLDE